MASYCPHRCVPCDAAGCRLFLSERDSDVSVRVRWLEEEWHFPAHRLLLGSSSEVFRKMFDADMLESNRGTLTIEDSSPRAVKGLLRYLYTGEADFPSWTEALNLLRIAHKYGVHTLTALCESHLAESCVHFSNACALQEAALTYALPRLEKRTTALVLGAAFVLLHTDGFLQMAPQTLRRFLRSRDLVVESESSVLSALREWATTRCSRKGVPLHRENVRREMEPFLRHIRWSMVPASQREWPAGSPDEEQPRTSFHISAVLQPHISVLKFVVELGAFHEGHTPSLLCLKFGVDNHAFVAGFRIVGMFRNNSSPSIRPSSLTLAKEDHRTYTQFNLNSLPWTRGTVVGDHVWRELTAYLPFPVRVDPFGNYVISLKYGSKRESSGARWPYTRLDSGAIATSLGTINFHCCSECYGITQLFILPAPPVKIGTPPLHE